MRNPMQALYLFLLTLLTQITLAQPSPKIILDVDAAEDVDDIGAIATLHALANQNEAEILGILISSNNEWVGPCVDAINTYYGRPNLPIGYQSEHQYGYLNTRDPHRPTPSRYAERVAKEFPHDLNQSSDAPNATSLCRQLLASQPDHSVTIVTVGFLTNLRSLLNSPPDDFSPLPGEALVAQKVLHWVCMGGIFPEGRFPNGGGEYNVMYDTIASVRAINDWPTPVLFSGFKIGAAIKTGSRLKNTPESNPVRACYLHYNNLSPRESWDQTAVLCAVRGHSAYWSLSEPGRCLMHAAIPHGYTEWIPSPNQTHHYLTPNLPPDKLAQIIEDLMTQPPSP